MLASCSRRRRVASTPSQCGIRRSISTMSGRSWIASASAWSPSAAVPTTSTPSSSPSRVPSPSRTTRWSSATRTRMAPFRPAPQLDQESAVGGPGGERAAEQFGSFPHAGEPVTGPVSGSLALAAGAGVLDGQPGPGRLISQADLDPVGAGVLADIGQCLLGDPVKGQPALGAQVPPVAGHGDFAGHAGVAFELGGQAGQPL